MASRYPAHGDFVVVEECEFVSGNSSVPFAVATGEYLGTLTRVDDTTYGLVDDDGSVVVAITHVYECEEDGWHEPRLIISGWKSDHGDLTHIRWIVTN